MLCVSILQISDETKTNISLYGYINSVNYILCFTLNIYYKTNYFVTN